MSFFDLLTGSQPPLVTQAFEDVQRMLDNGAEMFAAATAQLLDNEILDVDLAALDAEINDLEQQVRRLVLEHLNVAPKRELVFSLKLISIVHEAERIGDLAKTISRTAHLALKPRMGPRVAPLRALRDRILAMFEQTRAGFVQGDAEVARAQLAAHEETKAGLSDYLATLAAATDVTPNEALVLALGSRMMSRVSSHLANIASTVVFSFDQIRRSHQET